MIGDVLTSSILFEALRTKYPKAELHYLIHKPAFPVVQHNPFIDKFLLFNPKIDGKPGSLLSRAKKIRATGYDMVIDVYAKINSAVISGFSGAKIRVSYHKKYTSFAYSHTFKPATEAKTNAGLAIENRMLLLKAISEDFPTELKPKIHLTEVEKASAKAFLSKADVSEGKPLFMISILGSSPEKTYPLQYMADILDYIVCIKDEAQLLFNYIPSQEKEAKQLYELCSGETQKRIFFEVYGKSLREFMAITERCDALIGNEGGAVNMAKALEVPTFSIFSPQIKKENWSIYEDGHQNVSVHLKDFHPEKFTDKSRKELTKKSAEFYELLTPNLIFAKLNGFFKSNSAKTS